MQHQRRVMSYCVNTMNTVIHTVNNQSKRINCVAKHVNTFSTNKKRSHTDDFSIDSNYILKKIQKMSPYNDCAESDDDENTVDASVINEDEDKCSDFSHETVIPHNVQHRKPRDSDHLLDYAESMDQQFIDRVKVIANEFLRGYISDITISRQGWTSQHYKGFISYILCRILSSEFGKYNPTNDSKATVDYYIQDDNDLRDHVIAYAKKNLHVPQDRMSGIFSYPCTRFKRKVVVDAHWFYAEIHKRIHITGFKCHEKKEEDKRKSNSVNQFKPDDFQWFTQRNKVKKDQKGIKV